MPELELNPQKIYRMPNPVFVESIDNQYLVISRETANWLLLQNQHQLEIYHFLSDGKRVIDLFSAFTGDSQADIYKVLIELEAKRFENREVRYPQEHGMYIYLTNQCNQHCRHCYMFAGELNKTEMSTQEIECILKTLLRMMEKL